MIDLQDELAQDFLAECQERLQALDADLLAMEESGARADPELLERAFRSLHWVQGSAGLFDLAQAGELARQAGNVLGLIRSRQLPFTQDGIRVLLRATDRLRELLRDPTQSGHANIAGILAALSAYTGPNPSHPSAQRLRVLLAEDDFSSRLLLQTFLSTYGECHIAANGLEAVEAFRSALEHGHRYGLVCMDIMMPEMDGREAVRRIRALEEEHGILSTSGAKIVMTTALDDVKNVIQCFHELSDSYLTKPVDLAQLLGQMKGYRLIP